MSFCLEKLKRGTQTLPNLPSEPDTEREPNSTSAAPLNEACVKFFTSIHLAIVVTSLDFAEIFAKFGWGLGEIFKRNLGEVSAKVCLRASHDRTLS